MESTYTRRGVSPTKEDVHAAIQQYSLGLYPGAFCKIVEDLLGDPAYCSVMHADGAGTKSNLAYLHYRETGDPRAFRTIAQDSLVMNLDDILCVGATSGFVVSNTIGRNAHRIGGDIVREVITGYEEFAARMAEWGIEIFMAGGETADVGDLVTTVIVDSTVFTRLKRDDVIDCSRIRPGNVIIGLASFGEATYEDGYNSGIASNGFTAARHMLLSGDYATYTETFSTTLDPDDIYAGPYRLTDALPGSSQTIGDALLSPTRTYLPVMNVVFANFGAAITGIIHSSGGGQAKCAKFGNGLHYIKDNLFAPPPIFAALQASGGMGLAEMYQVFNMGQRLEIYSDPGAADEIIAVAEGFGIAAQVIGNVERSDLDTRNQLTIATEAGPLQYTQV